MDNIVVKTTVFRDHPGCKVLLEEKQDGQKHVRKSYGANNVSLNNVLLDDEEWDALCFLYNAGLNVPEPYKKDESGIYMQFIDNGMFSDLYNNASSNTQSNHLIDRFVRLLIDLHNIKPKTKAPPNGFIKNELAEIKTIVTNKQIDHYWDIVNELESLSLNIKEYPPCYIHRDYHIWNVLSDKEQKLYIIDMTLTQGDYRFDVGWTYMLMNRSSIHDVRFADFAQEFITRYCKFRPEACIDIEYFKQLANLRWLVNVTPDKKTDKPWFPEMMTIAEQAIQDFLKC